MLTLACGGGLPGLSSTDPAAAPGAGPAAEGAGATNTASATPGASAAGAATAGASTAGIVAPSPPGPPGVVTPAALLAAGVCAEDGAVASSKPYTLPSGRVLLEVNCAGTTYEYVVAEGLKRIPGADGKPLRLAGVPTFDADVGMVSNVSRNAHDCSTSRYTLNGAQFALMEQKRGPCPAKPGAAAPAGTIDGVVAADASVAVGVGAGHTHCAATEKTYFSCPTGKSKVVSVCGGPGGVQYRFGPLGAPELSFPPAPSKEGFAYEARRFAQSEAEVLSFDNGGVHYEITDAIGGGGGDGAEANNFQGVYVLQGEKLIATVRCAEAPTADWAGLKALFPTP